MADVKTTESLINRISELIEPMGYEVVHIEVMAQHRQKVLRVFIDHTETLAGRGIGIEDCVKVTKALDEPLDQVAEIAQIFGDAPYELEVSSPGIDRPLRQEKDFQRFAGRTIRVHVFRPLTADELENPVHQEKNPKQKNFVGSLLGLKNGKAVLSLIHDDGTSGKKAKSKKKPKGSESLTSENPKGAEVHIPLP
jgi:ribosome maturation factor RimP